MNEQLAIAGVARTGPVKTALVRPWSIVFSVPTTAGRVWFKAASSTTAFEVPLYRLLHQITPQHVPAPIAADVGLGWLLLSDGGHPLDERLALPEQIDALVTVLPRYGLMQRNLAPHVPNLLALGTPDMRPAIMPRRFTRALATVARFIEREGDDPDRAICEQLARLSDTVTAWSDRLASSPVAPSLDHNDLHPGNILVREPNAFDRPRFVDWGDSAVAHPFTSMLILLRYVQYALGVSHDDAAVQRVRDAYLEGFSDLAPRGELVATLESACQLGKITRSLSWASISRGAGRQSHSLRKRAVQWLGFLLNESYLGPP